MIAKFVLLMSNALWKAKQRLHTIRCAFLTWSVVTHGYTQSASLSEFFMYLDDRCDKRGIINFLCHRVEESGSKERKGERGGRERNSERKGKYERVWEKKKYKEEQRRGEMEKKKEREREQKYGSNMCFMSGVFVLNKRLKWAVRASALHIALLYFMHISCESGQNSLLYTTKSHFRNIM